MLILAAQRVDSFAATGALRVDYPQPSGAQLPQTLVVGDIDMATTGGAVINALLSVADHPEAETADPRSSLTIASLRS